MLKFHVRFLSSYLPPINLRIRPHRPDLLSSDISGTESPRILRAMLRYAKPDGASGFIAMGSPRFELRMTASSSGTIPNKSQPSI